MVANALSFSIFSPERVTICEINGSTILFLKKGRLETYRQEKFKCKTAGSKGTGLETAEKINYSLRHKKMETLIGLPEFRPERQPH